LALAEDYRGALLAFEAALTQAPDHTAARHNRQLVEAYLASLEEQSDTPDATDSDQPGPGTGTPSEQAGATDDAQAESQNNNASAQNATPEAGDNSSAASSNTAGQGSSDSGQAGEQGAALTGELVDSPDDSNAGSSESGVGGGGSSRHEIEQQQAVQQWLRDIHDNPAELLRRKFLYQHLQQPDGRPR
jgi:Ca-activated chloride channel family protein